MTQGTLLERPANSECAAYYRTYVELVPDGDVIDLLAGQIGETLSLLAPLDDRGAEHRYAPGKWSIKEIVGHLVDTERIFSLRALHFARRDPSYLPSMEQDEYVPEHGVFDCGGVRLMLGVPETPEFDHPGSIIYYVVDDIRSAYGTLRERGVAFSGEPHLVAKLPDHELWMVLFKDVDENTLALMSEVREE